MTRRTCRDKTCPCPNHLPPPNFNFLAAQAVPGRDEGPLAAYIFREETADGRRRVYVQTAETDYRVQLPLPADPPPLWADAVARAQRFVDRKPVMA